MDYPEIVPQAEWLAARKALLAREKALTRLRDELAAERRQLPMVEIDKPYIFAGPKGPVPLRDLFEGRRQLIVYHFVFDPSWEEGSRQCAHFADNVAGILVHLAARNTSFAVVSRAPIEKIEAFKRRMEWRFSWVSSIGTEFNEDFAVTIDAVGAEGSEDHNYQRAATLYRAAKIWFPKGELPGLSVFLRDGRRVFHTYSTYQRGLDLFFNTYNLLDVTPLGRQEKHGRMHAWIRYHDRYERSVPIRHQLFT